MIAISIVLYRPDLKELLPLVEELLLVHRLRRIYLIDNSPTRWTEWTMQNRRVSYIWNHGRNLGYGAGHNIALRKSIYNHTPYHLVMNSDILVRADDIRRLCEFMQQNPMVGSLMPHITYPNGETQYLCKLLPTPLDLFGRRFLPAFLTRRRNEQFTLRRDQHGRPVTDSYSRMLNVPYLSGCFMFLRTEAALRARLFDERYFMYPEDLDLTRTIHRDYLTLYYPEVTIVHNHAAASYHSLRMLGVHIVNMCRYFNKWGWFIDKERRLVNRLTMEQLSDKDSGCSAN